MKHRALQMMLCFLLSLQGGQAVSGRNLPIPTDTVAGILTNDNRSPAGVLRDGVLSLALEAREGIWHPEEADGPGLQIQAFAEKGHSPQIPGPLIRVPEGTEIHVTVRNAIPDAKLAVHGLHSRPGEGDESIEVLPGTIREIHFKAGAPGTYYYWGSTTRIPLTKRSGKDSQLSGALVVDPAGGKQDSDDRVFVVGWWSPDDPPTSPPRGRHVIVINGKSWPYTERLTYHVGDSVSWRWINASLGNHPMHLHGFYYHVESRGDGERDTIYKDSEQRLVVTELMEPGTTMSVRWSPQREGNWLFHCHVIAHIAPGLRLRAVETQSSIARHSISEHATQHMAGLVLGIHVLPVNNRPSPNRSHAVRSRKLELIAELQPGRYGKDPGFGFALREAGDSRKAAVSIPGPPLVLTRGQPVSITILNRLTEETSVHWHGIELESYYDGIPGWSGNGKHIAPAIPPGGSFAAEFTPPRAGTFIYHTHIDDIRQVSSGLYGPLIVLDPGKSFEPDADRILLLSVQGPSDNTPILLNGSLQPEPIEFHAGQKYRLRLINITPHDPLLKVSLLSKEGLAMWRPIAKDGADLPSVQGTARSAQQLVSVGETYDFEFESAEAGDLRLEIFRPARSNASPSIPESRMEVAVRVR